MQKRTSLMAVVFALVVLLVSASGVFAQVQLDHFDVFAPPESCVTCHSEAGAEHQAVYDDYADTSAFEVTIDSVASVDNGDGTYDVTMTFTIMKDGVAYIDADELPSLNQMRAYAVTYDSATGQFDNDHRLSNRGAGVIALGGGQYSVTSAMDFAPESTNAQVYIYIGKDPLDTEGMTLYSDVYNVGMAFGDAGTYESAANVEGCEKCHGTPYMKHGYRAAAVPGLSDFAACKVCHYDTRNGGHEDWQILVDNPARYAEIHAGADLTAEEEALYAYTANVMNDTHMSHAMEFPYPQSMSTCATCHEGKLDRILTDDNFKLETCLSCHPVNGPEDGTGANRAPALANVVPHSIEMGECSNCHSSGGLAPAFSEIHTGYDKVIYADAAGTKYSEIFTVSIDAVSLTDNVLTIEFSAVGDPNLSGLAVGDIVPTLLVGLYGYDTKDYLAGPHRRTHDDNGDGAIDRNDGRDLESPIGLPDAGHLRITTVSAAGGSWVVTADVSTWADKIADGTIKRAEIAVEPALDNADGDEVAINAVSRTFDLGANAFDDDFYSDIVDVENGCNTCHDALATTFHSPKRGGSIAVCRMCHMSLDDGSHIEMQSRAIESYVHAIHSFQAFDIGDVNFLDPVEAVHYDLHVEHVYPNFTIKNCESCHNAGTYEVPDQSKSLTGRLSKADEVATWDRNIGAVPSYVTGPASRACGACHRANLIKEDDAGKLAAFNQHTKDGGYLIAVEEEEAEGVLATVIETIMSIFQ